MKVRELIAALQRCPQNIEVVNMGERPIERVARRRGKDAYICLGHDEMELEDRESWITTEADRA